MPYREGPLMRPSDPTGSAWAGPWGCTGSSETAAAQSVIRLDASWQKAGGYLLRPGCMDASWQKARSYLLLPLTPYAVRLGRMRGQNEGHNRASGQTRARRTDPRKKANSRKKAN